MEIAPGCADASRLGCALRTWKPLSAEARVGAGPGSEPSDAVKISPAVRFQSIQPSWRFNIGA